MAATTTLNAILLYFCVHDEGKITHCGMALQWENVTDYQAAVGGVMKDLVQHILCCSIESSSILDITHGFVSSTMHAPDFSGRSSLLPGQSSEPHAQTGLARQLAMDAEPDQRESAIKVREARKSYGRLEVLRGLDMNVPYASMYVHRKTTLLLACFNRASDIDCQCYGFDARL